jgi:hypothetical protein
VFQKDHDNLWEGKNLNSFWGRAWEGWWFGLGVNNLCIFAIKEEVQGERERERERKRERECSI